MVRPLFIGLLMLLAAGCSNVKLSYPFIDLLIEHQVQPFLLDPPTHQIADQEIGRFVKWHTRQILPRYATLLRQVSNQLAAGQLDQTAVKRVVQQGVRILNQMSLQMIQHTAVVMSHHTSPAQLEHLKRAIWREDHERWQQLKKPREEQLKKRTASLVKSIEGLTGDLEPRQWRIIWRHLAPFFEHPDQWIRERRQRRQTFLAFLSQRPGQPQLKEFLKHHWITDLATRARVRTKQTERMIWALAASLTPLQRQTLVSSLRGYADDFTALSKKSQR